MYTSAYTDRQKRYICTKTDQTESSLACLKLQKDQKDRRNRGNTATRLQIYVYVCRFVGSIADRIKKYTVIRV